MFLVITHLPSVVEIGTYKVKSLDLALLLAQNHANCGLHTVVYDIAAGKQVFESKPVDFRKGI